MASLPSELDLVPNLEAKRSLNKLIISSDCFPLLTRFCQGYIPDEYLPLQLSQQAHKHQIIFLCK